MNDRMSQQFACCICNTRSGSPARESYTRFSKVQAKEDPTVTIKKLSPQASVSTKGSVKAEGLDLNANKGTEIPAGGQVMVGTRIAFQLPHNTYERIPPRSRLVVKH